jgi:hypothetical protein
MRTGGETCELRRWPSSTPRMGHQKRSRFPGQLWEHCSFDLTIQYFTQCLANLIYCCYGHPQQLMPTAQKLDSWLTRADPPPQAFRGTINEVLTTFYYFAKTAPYNKAFKSIDKRLAPVEFVFIGMHQLIRISVSPALIALFF